MMSVSLSWRQRGNEVYTSVTDSLAPCIRETRLLDALSKYCRALETAENEDERCSGAKNYGMAAWKLAVAYADLEGKPEHIVHYYMQSLQNFDQAIELGVDFKTLKWQQNIAEAFQDAFDSFVEYIAENKKKDRGFLLVKVAVKIKWETMKLTAFTEGARAHFGEAVRAREAEDYKKALYELHECYFPLEEMKRMCRKNELFLSEARVLEQDICLETCVAKSLQACATGDELLKKACSQYEDLAIPLVWEAVDMFRSAVLLTRENEVEMEAIGLCRMGNIFHSVLKMRHRAKDTYNRALQLAESLHPMSFDEKAWFQEAKSVMNQYHEESVEGQISKERAAKDKLKEELKPEIEHLSTLAQEGDHGISIMEFVYKTYSPKNKKHKIKAAYKEETKKALQQAITHYHPDRQDEKHGLRWKVLCEEITKFLTREYECMKM